MESTSETKKLELSVKHSEWVVKNGTFLDNYPGSDDYNIYQVYEEKTNVTTLFIVAFKDTNKKKPVNSCQLTLIGGKPL